MTTITGPFSRAIHAASLESDSTLPVLMFTVIGLLLSLCLVLALGAPPFVEFEMF